MDIEQPLTEAHPEDLRHLQQLRVGLLKAAQEAVSYTHLDVYKRQVPISMERARTKAMSLLLRLFIFLSFLLVK